MDKEIYIKLNTLQRVKSFVDIVDKFESDVDITQGRYIINAKSIMAIFSLNLLEALLVRIDSDDIEEIESFNNVMEEFKVDD